MPQAGIAEYWALSQVRWVAEFGVMTRRENILATVSDAVTDFLYYDRKEDETLGPEDIREAIAKGEISEEEIVAEFSRRLGAGLS